MRLSFLALALLFLSSVSHASGVCQTLPAIKASVMIPVGSFSDGEITPVQAKISELVKAGEKQIVLQVNSNGGSVETGWQFVSFLKDTKKHGVRISCYVDWKAYSMGLSFIEAACDDRWSAPNGTFLFHEASGGAQGRVKDLKEEAVVLEMINHTLAVVISERIGMSLADYEKKVAAGNWWMNADEALKEHAIDAIRDSSDLPPLAEMKHSEDTTAFLFRRLLRH